jgi:16S rRNA (guanine1207-N2)-methyltransferase
MENTSEVILRNEALLDHGAVLLINTPRDMLFNSLQSGGRSVRISTQDHGDYQWLERAGADAGFEVVPSLATQTPTIILRLPREKDRLDMLLHSIASGMPPDARLWLVGEIRAGIKSAPSRLEYHFRRVEKLDSARHCVLLEAGEPCPARHFNLQDYEMPWQVKFAGQDLELLSLPGVFAHGRLDKGTAMLLEVLEGLRPTGRILDFACGSGVIGLSLLKAGKDSEQVLDMTLLDASSLAIESSRRSLAANGLKAALLPSDGLSRLTEHYDWIISNPPFHSGVANNLNISADFFHQAGTFLKEKGRILVVFNRHLPYQRWMQEQFESVDCLTGNREFSIVQASRPIQHR